MASGSGPKTNIDGLIFSLDAANKNSYSGIGLTAYDLIANVSESLVNGTGFTSSGGGSFVFDGTNDYLTSLANIGVVGSNPRTICIWFYMSASQSKNVYGYGQGFGGQIFDIITWDTSGFNRVIGHYWGGGNDTIATLPSRNTLNVPGWNFVVHIYTGTSVSIYTNTEFSNSTNLPLNTASGPLTLGRGTYVDYDFFAGRISNFQIYNRVLSVSEITSIYNATKGRYL